MNLIENWSKINLFLVANLNSDEPYLTIGSDKITSYLMEYKKYTDLAVVVIGFKRK